MLKNLCIITSLLVVTSCISTHNRWTRIIDNSEINVVATAVTKDGEEFFTGTGFIIGKNLIATAGHVAQSLDTKYSKSNPRIKLSNKEILKIKHIYHDCSDTRKTDIGLIVTEGMKTKQYLKLRRELPKPGEDVVTIGNPGDFIYIASRGSVMKNTKDKPKVGKLIDIIRIANRISYGASGSPVMDVNGKVIGVVVRFLKIDEMGFYSTSVMPIKYIDPILKYHKDLQK